MELTTFDINYTIRHSLNILTLLIPNLLTLFSICLSIALVVMILILTYRITLSSLIVLCHVFSLILTSGLPGVFPEDVPGCLDRVLDNGGRIVCPQDKKNVKFER